jgi:ABC-type cobalamin/Fe3+-siderophores transport systems, ATPase components
MNKPENSPLTQATALTVENLSFSYARKKALDQVSFSVNASQCTILLGPNGAGKSTLFP